MKNFIAALNGYLKRSLKTIIIFIILSFIFMIVFYLYSADTEPVIYAFILCCFTGMICGCSGFYRYYKKHVCLRYLRNQITADITDLPESGNLIEKDYQELIRILYNENQNIISLSDTSKKNMNGYYTMWVHQIKTPIAAMRLLLQSDPHSDSKELEEQLFKIEQYVEMVLSYLRINSTSTDFVIARYSLDDIIKQAVRKYAKLFIRKKISLEFTESGSEVLTDEKWLLFVIEQILSNSLKYTSSGKITISTTNEKFLVIADTGIGISAEDLPRVFENGYTGFNGRLDKKSTGIGLYLCSTIIKKLGHTIRIESEPGSGTRVIIGLDSVNLFVE